MKTKYTFRKGQKVDLDQFYEFRAFVDGYMKPVNEHNAYNWDEDLSETFVCTKNVEITVEVKTF